ncbi:MAG: hypothetical protein OXD47_06610 [Gammaproteobacteria bacterium]|nr:hypothetical protein [Gammaproteobacteria bacterium]
MAAATAINCKEKQMGTFYTECLLENYQNRTRSIRVPQLLVDTGSECSWIQEQRLEQAGIIPEKRRRFVIANGEMVTRPVGYAIVYVSNSSTVDEIVFAQKDDMELLGARTMEGLNLLVDPANKKLIDGGPMLAATPVLVND